LWGDLRIVPPGQSPAKVAKQEFDKFCDTTKQIMVPYFINLQKQQEDDALLTNTELRDHRDIPEDGMNAYRDMISNDIISCALLPIHPEYHSSFWNRMLRITTSGYRNPDMTVTPQSLYGLDVPQPAGDFDAQYTKQRNRTLNAVHVNGDPKNIELGSDLEAAKTLILHFVQAYALQNLDGEC
jgi:hypothetical protein